MDGDAKLNFAEFSDFIMSQVNSASPFTKESPAKAKRNASPVKHKRPGSSGRPCINPKGRPCKDAARCHEFETPSRLSGNIEQSIRNMASSPSRKSVHFDERLEHYSPARKSPPRRADSPLRSPCMKVETAQSGCRFNGPVRNESEK